MRSRLASAALFFLLAVVLFWQAAVGGKVLSGSDLLLFEPPFAPPPGLTRASNEFLFDAAYVFEPDQLQVRKDLRGGHLPLWNPTISAGRPLLASQQAAPPFPINWLASLLPYHRALVWIALLKLALAALGTFLFCRARGLPRAAAILGGICFGFSSYLVVWLAHPQSNSFAVLPWLFLLGDRLVGRGGIGSAAGLAGAVGILLMGGHPETALLELLGLVAYAACVAWTLPDRRLGLRRGALVGAALVVGVEVGAVMLLPLLEALGQSYATSRGGAPLPDRAGLGLFLPEYWGRPDRIGVAGAPSNFAERTAYLGAVPVVLAMAGLVARRPSRTQLGFALLALVSAAIAYASGPISDTVRKLPVLKDVALHRILVLLVFAGAVLAAYGLDVALRGDERARRRLLAVAALLVLLPGLGLLAHQTGTLSSTGSALGQAAHVSDALPPGPVLALAAILRWLAFGLAGLALLALAVLRPARAALAVTGIGALAAPDLRAVDAGYQPSVPRANADPPPPPAVRFMQRAAPQERVAADLEFLGPNSAARYGLRDIRGHELPLIERHRLLWAALGGAGGLQRTLVATGNAASAKLLDAFAVRYVYSTQLAARGYPILLADARGGRLVENRTALPRAFVVHRWRRAGSMQDALRQVKDSSSAGLGDAPILEGAGRPPGGGPARTPARITAESDSSLTLEESSSGRGYLVLLDTYYPGWRATVDGSKARIRPANAGFRAVEVPAGRHRVRFDYRPASVYAGGVISLAALGLVAAGLVLARRRRYGAPS